jgi:branched-chain amino acid transport system ATP-binding protein
MNVSSAKAHHVANLGLGYVPQGRRIFPQLTVLENLMVTAKSKSAATDLNEVFGYFPVLEQRAKQLGGTLSGGQQQMLAIGRAIMLKPKLIIFDEPTEGLQPSMVEEVRQTIKAFRSRGITAIVADQNLENALELCDRVYVLEKGQIKHEQASDGLSLELLCRYLGVVKGTAAGAPV